MAETYMDIFDVLREEHESVAEQLEELAESGRDDRAFEALRTDLILHALAEEQVLYRRLETDEETAGLVRRGHRQHRVMMRMLDDMSGSPEDEDSWMRSLRALSEDVRLHVVEEEGELFPRARRVIEPREAERMSVRFERAKGDIAA